MADNVAIGRLPPDSALELARRIDRSDADTLVFACTNWRILAAIDRIEAELGKPVVSSTQATVHGALRALGVGRGHTVSVMLPNTPEMVEAHYAVPALNAVLNTLNTRLDASLLAWQMNHCEAQVLITDTEFGQIGRAHV